MKNLLIIAVKAAISAGTEILKIYNDANADFEIERKADNSPLTIADRRANDVIVSMLEPTLTPILSEEGKVMPYEERASWKKLWIVDPLDGTKEFIKRNGEFTVNIAFVEDSAPVMGVIFVPVTGTLYFGIKGEGAYRLESDDLPDEITFDSLVSASRKLPFAYTECFTVVASRSHNTPETEEYLDGERDLHGDIEIITKGSSLKICLVAEGSADVYPRFAPTMEWDTAAGHAIAIAAGKQLYKANFCTPLIYNKEDLLNPWFIAK